MQQTLNNLEVQYTYHVHEGSSGDTANGCYTTPEYHTHTDSCYETITGRWSKTSDYTGAVYVKCTRCGAKGTAGMGLEGTVHCSGKSLTCKIDTTIIIAYTLGCGKTEDTIESATIIF